MVENATTQNATNVTWDFSSVFNGNDTRRLNGTGDSQTRLNLYAMPEIPEWLSKLYFTTLCLSIVLGVPGNAITAAAYAKIKNKSNCDWYIFFVAMFDLVACVFRNTEYILEYLGQWMKYSNSNYCKFVTWLSQTTVCVSIFVFGLIAVDRYMKLCTISRMTITPKKSRDLSLILIVINLIIATPNLYINHNNDRGLCTLKRNLFTSTLVIAYYSLIFVFFLIMTVVVVFCYICIAIKVRNTRRVGVKVEQSLRSGDLGTEISVNSYTKRDTKCTLQILPQTNIIPLTTLVVPQSNLTISLSSHQLHIEAVPVKPLPKPSGQNALPASKNALPASTVNPDNVSNSSKNNDRCAVDLQHLSVDPDTDQRFVKRACTSSGSHTISSLANARHALRQKRNVRVTGLLFVVTTVFIISWIPPYIAIVKAFYIGYAFPFTVPEFILLNYGPNVYILNNFSNPIIYIIMSSTYRTNVLEYFKSVKIACYKMCH